MQLDLGCALLGDGTAEATLCFHPFPFPSLLLQAAELPLTPSSGAQEGVISVEVVNFFLVRLPFLLSLVMANGFLQI